MKTIRAKNGEKVEVKWGLGPLSNGQVYVDLPKDYTMRKVSELFEGLEEIAITDEKDVETVYKGYTELVDVQRMRAKNETRLVYEKP